MGYEYRQGNRSRCKRFKLSGENIGSSGSSSRCDIFFLGLFCDDIGMGGNQRVQSGIIMLQLTRSSMCINQLYKSVNVQNMKKLVVIGHGKFYIIARMLDASY